LTAQAPCDILNNKVKTMILNSLFYISGREIGTERFLGVFDNEHINKAIEEDLHEHPERLYRGYRIIPVQVNKTRVYREWEW